ncbi:GerAB/ArcD/ProY family transporter [Tumebacillus permanentifrigoris]|uniref:Spore germination protein n=1 Tax=Tumebacillus permanentifrigoris TaxID=378543 RepID=A0A316DDI7_9BACL|nr:endospore germination permease [Tumebacillus permanentifrigoris]PWK15688.1 spore germination protein [Tumebacillus permanentifrigoris]
MERISERQAMLIGAGIIFDATLISIPAQLLGVAHQDAWLTYLVAGVAVAASLWLLSRVGSRFVEVDLYEALVTRFKWVGRMVVLMYTFFVFFLVCRDLRMVSDFVNIHLLQKTPLVVISILVVLVVVFIARGGVELLARMTELYLPLLFFVVLILPLLLGKEFELRYYKPIFEHGVGDVLEGGWLAVSYVSEIALLPFFLSHKVFRLRTGLYGMGIGVFFLTLLIALNIVTLGPHIASRFMYPNIELIRQIRITDFLDRFDIAIVSIWLPSIITKIGYLLYICCHGIKRVTPGMSAKQITTAVGLVALTCSFWFFENSIQLIKVNYVWPVVATLFAFVLPLLMFFFLKPKPMR